MQTLEPCSNVEMAVKNSLWNGLHREHLLPKGPKDLLSAYPENGILWESALDVVTMRVLKYWAFGGDKVIEFGNFKYVNILFF